MPAGVFFKSIFALISQKMAKMFVTGWTFFGFVRVAHQCCEIPFVLKQLAIMVAIKVIFPPNDVVFEIFTKHEVL